MAAARRQPGGGRLAIAQTPTRRKVRQMAEETLEQKINRIGNPARMLRSNPTGSYTFPVLKAEYTSWQDEQEAWNKTAVLYDQSFHMTDVYFDGPDVKRLFSDVAINSFATFGKNKAKQLVCCNEDGYLIGDAILFAWSDHRVSLVGIPTLPDWVQSHAERGGYDVEITRDERTLDNKGNRLLFRYQIQGPVAGKIVEKAHGGPIDRIKFFNIGEFTIAAVPVRALNHTMTGIPGQELTGLEITGPSEQGPAVLEALLRAGEEFGLRQGGAISYSTTAVESGWWGLCVPAIHTGEGAKGHREWLRGAGFEGAASLGGSFVSDDIRDYYMTPWDQGYDRVIRFDHDFIGRPALEQMQDQPHRRKVWLVWDDDDVAKVMARSLYGGEERAKYLKLPSANYVTFLYDEVHAGDHVAGLSSRTAYTVNMGHVASLAAIDEAEVRDGAEVTVIWGEPDGGASRPTTERHVQVPVRATISTQPPG
jgi:vanillate/3-O-methylgallate O-demethylase